MRGRAFEIVDGATEEVGLCLGWITVGLCLVWIKVGVATGLRIVLILDGEGEGKPELLGIGRVRFMMERESDDVVVEIIFGTGGGGLGGGLCW